MTEQSNKQQFEKRDAKAGNKAKSATIPGSGLRSLRTTSVFRAVNFELYARPNKVVMGLGLTAITLCVGYLAYMNAQSENKELYEAYNIDGTTQMQRKSSKWD
uniref:small integral membrane protein 8-like n=1 Tax=Styela clava TaxID=7725 RepID=UPI001939AB65|nr:small integral membrane protein 8-like [Styela clava]